MRSVGFVLDKDVLPIRYDVICFAYDFEMQ